MSWRWTLESATGAFGTDRIDGRELSIRWDDHDASWYLSVLVYPQQQMGEPVPQPRAYVAPLSLLGVLALIPAELHEHAVARVDGELERLRGDVFRLMAGLAGDVPRDWPGPVEAAKTMRAMAELAGDVERLGMDAAGASAWV